MHGFSAIPRHLQMLAFTSSAFIFSSTDLCFAVFSIGDWQRELFGLKKENNNDDDDEDVKMLLELSGVKYVGD